jgi:formate hydrogenlyase subunit 3/multisubunit Na+/H+ antiporter MnhD subunit
MSGSRGGPRRKVEIKFQMCSIIEGTLFMLRQDNLGSHSIYSIWTSMHSILWNYCNGVKLPPQVLKVCLQSPDSRLLNSEAP